MRSQWINELVDAGYDAGVLDTLNNNELAELVQEEFVENTWSPEARAAAASKRRNRASAMAKHLEEHGYQKSPETYLGGFHAYTKQHIGVKEYHNTAGVRTTMPRAGRFHTVSVHPETGAWKSKVGKRLHSGVGLRSMAKVVGK